jgi:hypothetical protein
MPDMQYETGTLRDGARTDRESADGARGVESALRARSVAASAFGDVTNAARIAAQTVTTRDGQAGGAAAAGQDRDEQGARAGAAATQGDQLTSASTGIARSAPATARTF